MPLSEEQLRKLSEKHNSDFSDVERLARAYEEIRAETSLNGEALKRLEQHHFNDGEPVRARLVMCVRAYASLNQLTDYQIVDGCLTIRLDRNQSDQSA